jgi:AcrR family transcriptional regulator
MTIEPLTPERRRQQTRDHLLEAAARVFGERGYHGASLDDIAAAAGFTKGAVYSNFKSKEDLFLALLESRFASELEDLKAVLAQSEVGADDRLSDFVTLIVEQPNDPARVTWGTLYEEFHLYARRNPEARARLAELDRRDVASVAEILRTERGRLNLDPATSPEDAARITLALTRGIAMMQTTDPDAIDQRFLESMLEFLARALTS